MATPIGHYEIIFSNSHVAGEPTPPLHEDQMEMDVQNQKIDLFEQYKNTLTRYTELKQSCSDSMKNLINELEKNQARQLQLLCFSSANEEEFLNELKVNLEKKENDILSTMRKLNNSAYKLEENIKSLTEKMNKIQELSGE